MVGTSTTATSRIYRTIYRTLYLTFLIDCFVATVGKGAGEVMVAAQGVSLQCKNPDFLLKNPDFFFEESRFPIEES